MADQLSPSDRSSLAAEQGPINMAVAGAMVVQAGAGTTYEAIRARLLERIHLLPRYRQRVEQAPLGLAQPIWVDDDAFDVDWHLRRGTLPAPGGHDELARYIAQEMSRRLDRSRPLWELHVIEGMSDDRTVLLPKMHHALVDGIAAVDIGTVLVDPTPEPMEVPPPDAEWAPREYDRKRHIARLAATPLIRAQKLAFDSAARALDTSPRRAAEDLKRATDLLTELARTRPQAPMTTLNNPISPNRSFAMARAGLPELKVAGKRAGGTVNDVLLAIVTGMLRRFLSGQLNGSAPVALVPVSVRKEGEEGGNHISTVFVDLPVELDDPLERIARIAETTRHLKGSSAVRAGALIVGATGLAPPVFSSMLVRGLGGMRAMNLVVSNVPGPRQPFYISGSRMLEVYPVVPLNPGNQGLSVGILSYDGGVHFGMLADRNLNPAVPQALTALHESLTELLAAAAA